MNQILNLKKRKKRLIGKMEIIIALTAIVLATTGIKAGDYFLSSRAEQDVGQGGCPLDMAFVNTDYGGFCIDKYEASTNDKCSHSNPGNKFDTAFNLGLPDCWPVSMLGKIPWRNITQSQAIEACAKAGKRLPTGMEWHLASLGTPDINSGWGANDCQVNENWDSQPGKTGSASNCVSAAGAYDMVGNVWEWVREEIQDGVYKDKQLPDSGYVKAININGLPIETDSSSSDEVYNNDYFWIKNKGTRGMACGGYWDNKSDAGKNAVYLVSPPSFAGIGMGFRCVK